MTGHSVDVDNLLDNTVVIDIRLTAGMFEKCEEFGVDPIKKVITLGLKERELKREDNLIERKCNTLQSQFHDEGLLKMLSIFSSITSFEVIHVQYVTEFQPFRGVLRGNLSRPSQILLRPGVCRAYTSGPRWQSS